MTDKIVTPEGRPSLRSMLVMDDESELLTIAAIRSFHDSDRTIFLDTLTESNWNLPIASA